MFLLVVENKSDKIKNIMNTSPTTFYIVRHGETQQNADRIIQGHLDTVLNENGITQAKKLEEMLTETMFDNAFSSDLKRAHQTAKLIVSKKNLEIETDNLLREIKLGKYEGKKIDLFNKELGDVMKYRNQLSTEERFIHRAAEDIETDEELMNRFLQFFEKNNQLTNGKNNLLVTHGAAMRILLVYLGWAKYLELPHGSIKNTAYVVLEKNDDGFVVKETFGIEKQV